MTIVTAERIVSTDELMAMRGGIQLAGVYVTHVVELPGGSLPTSCYPDHRLDVAAVLDYADAAPTPPRGRAGSTRATGALRHDRRS